MSMEGFNMPSKVVAKKGRVCILHDLGVSINDHDVVDLTALNTEKVARSAELRAFLEQGLIIPYEEGVALPKPPKPYIEIPQMKVTIGGGATSVKIGITEQKKQFAPSEYVYETTVPEETIAEISSAEARAKLERLQEQEELLKEEEELAARQHVYKTQTKPLPEIKTVRVDGAEVSKDSWKAPKSAKLKKIEADAENLGLAKVIDQKKPE